MELPLSCRLCLTPKQHFSLFEKCKNQKRYYEIASDIFNFQFSEVDNLPKKICMECASKLSLFYKFKKICLETQSKLQQEYCNSDLKGNQSPAENDNENYVEKFGFVQYELVEDEEEIISTINEENDDDYTNDEYLSNELSNESQIISINIDQNTKKSTSRNGDDEEMYNVEYLDEEEDQKIEEMKYSSRNECEHCGRKFSRKYILLQHLRQHTGIKEYVCDLCKREFTRKEHLNAHMRRHTNTKPYKCDKCMYTFATSGELTRHKLTHTDIRNFSCDICDKRFRRSSDVSIHRRTHTKEQPYLCVQCDKRYAHFSSLRKHQRKH